METHKTLVVGTGNIRASTASWLAAQVTDGSPDMVVYPKEEVGFWVRVPLRREMDDNVVLGRTGKIPFELFGLFWVAIEHGCEWIMIDRDAADADLPQWDW